MKLERKYSTCHHRHACKMCIDVILADCCLFHLYENRQEWQLSHNSTNMGEHGHEDAAGYQAAKKNWN